jgi:hypothetical protein
LDGQKPKKNLESCFNENKNSFHRRLAVNDNNNSWGDIDDPGYRATYTANDRYDRAGDQAPESDIVRLSCQRNCPTWF